MKKFGLSAFVIALFVAYSLHQRGEAQEVAVVTPKSLPAENHTSALNSSNPITPTNTPAPIDTTTSQPTTKVAGQYKDGIYTGSVADAFYGYIQVKAIISGGRITDVQFLQYPNDRSTSVMINQQAMPYLKEEAIQAQSAQVDIVSGATDSSQAFIQSLQSALSQAKNG